VPPTSPPSSPLEAHVYALSPTGDNLHPEDCRVTILLPGGNPTYGDRPVLEVVAAASKRNADALLNDPEASAAALSANPAAAGTAGNTVLPRSKKPKSGPGGFQPREPSPPPSAEKASASGKGSNEKFDPGSSNAAMAPSKRLEAARRGKGSGGAGKNGSGSAKKSNSGGGGASAADVDAALGERNGSEDQSSDRSRSGSGSNDGATLPGSEAGSGGSKNGAPSSTNLGSGSSGKVSGNLTHATLLHTRFENNPSAPK